MKPRILVGSSLLVAAVLCYGIIAKPLSYKPDAEAINILQKNGFSARANGLAGSYYVFRPEQSEDTKKGFIFYPGGLVDPRAYAPLMRDIARQGYLSVIVSMPADLAVLGAERAADIIAMYPAVTGWAIGGHSLGGAMACRFARKHPDMVKGVVLWASYPSATFSLAATSLPAISIFGTSDGFATPEKIEKSKKDLPPETQFIAITGGNHTQFGWYGNGKPQHGDLPAGISRLLQQKIIVQNTVNFMERL